MTDDNGIEYFHPRSGRLVDEQGNYVNQGDALTLSLLADSAIASREGNVYRAFYYSNNLVDATYVLYIDIPPGIELIGFSRVTEIKEANSTSEFLVLSSAQPGAFSQVGANFDERLEDTSQSTLRLTDGTQTIIGIRTPPKPLDAPTTTSIRSKSTQTEVGFQPKFDSTHLPAFRYVVTGGPATYFAVELTWQELTI